MSTQRRRRNRHHDHDLIPDGPELWWCADCWVHVRRPRPMSAPAPRLRR